jgi:hypothetical protein
MVAHDGRSTSDFVEELTGRISRDLAEGVLRASGLAAYTQAGRWAFGMEFLGHLTDQIAKRFEELDPRLQRAMQRHGIGADTWDIIRSSPLEEHKGVGWILPQNVEDQLAGDAPVADDPNGNRLRRARRPIAHAGDDEQRCAEGHLDGRDRRSALLFKSFGISS